MISSIAKGNNNTSNNNNNNLKRKSESQSIKGPPPPANLQSLSTVGNEDKSLFKKQKR